MGLQGGVATLHGVDLLGLGGKAEGHLLPLLLSQGTGGDALGQRPVVTVENVLLDQMLEVAIIGGHSLTQGGQVIDGGSVVILHVGAHEGHHHAEARLDAEGGAAAIRLMAIHQVADASLIQPLLGQLGQGIQDHLAEALGRLGIRLAQGEIEHGLAVVALTGHAEVLAYARVQHGAGEGGFGVLGQVAGEQGEGQHLGRLVLTQHVGEHEVGVALDLLVVAQLIVDRSLGADHGGLQGGGSGLFVGGLALGAEHAVNVGQLLLQAHVAREVENGVLRAVEAVVGLHELLIGQIGDVGGVAARVVLEEQIGEDLLFVLHPHDVVGLVIVALHLVEHHAGDGHAALSIGLHVPGLLFKNAAIRQEQGVEHGVHIHGHEVHIILLVGGNEIVDGLVLKGHGVEVNGHGGLQKIDEGLLQTVVLGAVQAGVLQDMEHARVILGQGAEANGKHQLTVITVGIVHGSARGLVHELAVAGIQKRNVTLGHNAKAVMQRANSQIDHDFYLLCMNTVSQTEDTGIDT